MPGLIVGVLGVVLLLLVAWLAFVALLWLHRPSPDVAGAALRLPPDVVHLCRSLAADPSTPRPVKLALGGLVAYLASPIDLVPDFVPLIGLLDDVIVAGLVLRCVGRQVGTAVIESHWSGTPTGLAWLLRLI